MSERPLDVLSILLCDLIDAVHARPADRAELVQNFARQMLGLIDTATDQATACTLRALGREH